MGGGSDTVLITKTIANASSAMNTAQVTRCEYRGGGEAGSCRTRATAPGSAGHSSARPRGKRLARKPGNSGEVRQRPGAWVMSSPRNRTEKTRRRFGPENALRRMQREHVKAHGIAGLQLPAENGIGVAGGLDIRQIRRDMPSGNHFACASMKERAISQGPKCGAGHEFPGSIRDSRDRRGSRN